MRMLPIVFCFNEKFRLPAYVAVSSLLQAASPERAYHIYVIHDGLMTQTVDHFKDLVRSSNSCIEFILFDTETIRALPHSKKWPPIVYARLFIPELISNHDRVLYSDVDVIFIDDLDDLYHLYMNDSAIAAVPAEQLQSATTHQRLDTYTNRFIYMSGLILFNIEKCMGAPISNRIERCVTAIGEARIKMFDLEVMNTMYENICGIDLRYCVLENLLEPSYTDSIEYGFLSEVFSDREIEDAIQNKAIIHYAGLPVKVWNRACPPDVYFNYIKRSPFYPDWEEHQRRKRAAAGGIFLRAMSRFHPRKRRRKELRELIKEYNLEHAPSGSSFV